MSAFKDGPSSNSFSPVSFQGNVSLDALQDLAISVEMATALVHAPRGRGVAWGIPFEIDQVVAVADTPVTVQWSAVPAQWLVFMHTSDLRRIEPGPDGFISPMQGQGRLAEHAADYVVLYADGTEERLVVRRRHHLGAFQRRWGENCFEAVAHHKPYAMRAAHEQLRADWGRTQTRATAADGGLWINWLWAWENPHPVVEVVGVRVEPVSGIVVVSAISAGTATSQPLRWESRQKACLTLPEGEPFVPGLSGMGCWSRSNWIWDRSSRLRRA